MIWGFPAAFWFSAALIPVAAIFFYRRRSRVLKVPAVQLWLTLGRPVDVHSMRSLLRRLLSLLAQLLVVMLLVLALADPSPRKQAAQRTIVVMDVSATMQTREGSLTRMDAAREQALKVVDGLPEDAEVIVIQAAHAPMVVNSAPAGGAPSSWREKPRRPAGAHKTIAVMEAQDVDGDLQRGVSTAMAFVDQQVPTEVVVVSDFAGEDLAALRQMARSVPMRLVPVGSEQPNAAITGLWSENEPGGRRVAATIAQRGLTGTRLPVQLRMNGQQVATEEVLLGEKPVIASFLKPMPPGTSFEVILGRDDALAADNRASGVVTLRDQIGICLVSEGNPALERALAAEPSARVRVVSHEKYTGPGNDAVVIVDGPGLKSAEIGNARGFLLIGAADPFGLGRSEGAGDAPAITHWAAGHPSMEEIDPTLFRVVRAMKMNWTAAAGATELVGADRIPLIVETRPRAKSGPTEREVRCLYWLFGLNDSDLPRRLTFPLLLWNAIDYLVHGEQAAGQDVMLTGRPLKLKGAEAEKPVVIDPAGKTLAAKTAPGGWVVNDTFRQGLYRRTDTAEVFAVNLLSSRGVMPLGRDAGVVAVAKLEPKKEGWFGLRARISWGLLLACAGALAVIEWVLFNRGVIRIG